MRAAFSEVVVLAAAPDGGKFETCPTTAAGSSDIPARGASKGQPRNNADDESDDGAVQGTLATSNHEIGSVTPTALDVQAAGPGKSGPSPAQQIGNEIIARAEVVSRDGRTEIHIRLEPPELGTVRVYLSASEHTLSARLVVSDEAVRQLLIGQLDTLRQNLAMRGISLGSFNVTRDGGGAGNPGTQEQPGPIPTPAMTDSSRLAQTVSLPPAASLQPGRIDVLA